MAARLPTGDSSSGTTRLMARRTYAGAGFDEGLREEAKRRQVLLAGLGQLYATEAGS
jgi:hypothetical protein